MAFLGMKGTGQFAVDERPKSWREGILYDFPNGTAPITAILSKMESEATTDYEFYWWTKTLPDEVADVTGIYTDVDLSSAYTTAAKAKGDLLYLKMAEEDSQKFRKGLVVHFLDKSAKTKKGYGRTVTVVQNGASSYVSVKLIKAIASSGATGIDFVRIIGTSNAQGAARPQSQLTTPVKHYNLTQIFRDPLSMTRTALQTKLRTAKARKEARREALQYHAIRMEKAFYDGVMSETLGENGLPETTTQGIIPFIQDNAPDNTGDYEVDSNYDATTWLAGGKNWLNDKLEVIYRYGNTEKLAICGSGALKGINDLAESLGTIDLKVRQADYGLQVVEWVHSAGVMYLMTSPLFTQDITKRNSLMIVEPENLKFRYIQDTIFKGDTEYDSQESSDTGVDGAEEEFLTEAGLEMHFPNHFGYLEGVGLDNPE